MLPEFQDPRSNRRVTITRRRLLVNALLTATAIGLASCTGLDRQPTGASRATPLAGPQPTSILKPGGTLRLSQPQDINQASMPHLAIPTNLAFYNLVYDTLVGIDAERNLRPRLATSWEWSSDFSKLTLKLRSGVKFHTGRAFTSQDAKFNLERVRDPAIGSQWLTYAQAMHVETPDLATLVIGYDVPRKSSFDAVAGIFMGDPQTMNNQVGDSPAFVGTGPFRFKEWAQGDHVTVTRNPDYWQPGKPLLDNVEMRIVPDPQTTAVNLEAGAVDLTSVSGQDARRLQKDAAYQVLPSTNGASFWYLGVDVSVPGLSDKRVRQALAYAIDRQRIIDTALFGFGRPESILWPRQSPFYDSGQDATYTYNPGKARELLAAAGWDTSATVSLTVSNIAPPLHTAAEILQEDLNKIGVRVAIQKIDSASFTPRLQKGQFGGAYLAVSAYANLSPATVLSAFSFRVPGATNFATPRYKELVDRTSSETDDQTLKGVVRELTQIMLDEAFVIPFSESFGTSGIDVARRAVRNITSDAWGLYNYQDIALEA
jgi:peptide/nickel transport system substrate-binding protein